MNLLILNCHEYKQVLISQLRNLYKNVNVIIKFNYIENIQHLLKYLLKYCDINFANLLRDSFAHSVILIQCYDHIKFCLYRKLNNKLLTSNNNAILNEYLILEN